MNVCVAGPMDAHNNQTIINHLATCPFLGSFVAVLSPNLHGYLLHGSAEHISTLALVARADGKDMTFEVLAGPNFCCLVWHSS
jgi:hypothetical protein